MLTSEQEDRLETILQMADHPLLTAWEKSFLTNLAERYEEQGEAVVVSGKMWSVLLRIETKVQREDV